MITENKLLFEGFEKCLCFSTFCSHEIWENNFLSQATPFIFIKLSFRNFSKVQQLCKDSRILSSSYKLLEAVLPKIPFPGLLYSVVG
jgi:hypothetical protein